MNHEFLFQIQKLPYIFMKNSTYVACDNLEI